MNLTSTGTPIIAVKLMRLHDATADLTFALHGIDPATVSLEQRRGLDNHLAGIEKTVAEFRAKINLAEPAPEGVAL